MAEQSKAPVHKGFEKNMGKTRYHTAFEAKWLLYLFFTAGKYYPQMHAMAELQPIYKYLFFLNKVLLQSKTFYICCTINSQKNHYEQS